MTGLFMLHIQILKHILEEKNKQKGSVWLAF